MAKDNGCDVVLTGEGSDEVWAGYDIFKESIILSELESGSLSTDDLATHIAGLYPYLNPSPVFLMGLAQRYRSILGQYPDVRPFAQLIRWNSVSNVNGIFDFELSPLNLYEHLNDRYRGGDQASPLRHSMEIESLTLLHGYLLSTQGDRMCSAHSVESRMPFLDYRLVSMSRKLADEELIPNQNEKYFLKSRLGSLVPDPILRRPKAPYRSPDMEVFFEKGGCRQQLATHDGGPDFE